MCLQILEKPLGVRAVGWLTGPLDDFYIMSLISNKTVNFLPM